MTYEEIMSSRQLAGRVTRFHTYPMLHKPTNAAHSARVATLYCELWGLPRAEVLYYCLHHDSGELAAGDTPQPAKREVPGLKRAVDDAELMGRITLGVVLPELTDEEFWRFKVSDLLELFECAVVERTMGNKYAEPVLVEAERAARKIGDEKLTTWDRGKLMKWLEYNKGDITP